MRDELPTLGFLLDPDEGRIHREIVSVIFPSQATGVDEYLFGNNVFLLLCARGPRPAHAQCDAVE